MRTRTVREIVEVVAIVLAGAWALYVFVFQNVILPGLAPPSPTFIVHMRHVGNDGTLAVVRFDETIRNIGTVRVHFLAHSVTVLGMRVLPLSQPQHVKPSSALGETYAYSRLTKPHVVYRSIIVTGLGEPKSPKDLFVDPGQEITFAREFYAPRGSFDRLVAYLVAVFTKDDSHTIPTTVTIAPSGLPRFRWKGTDVQQVAEPMAELDLRAE